MFKETTLTYNVTVTEGYSPERVAVFLESYQDVTILIRSPNTLQVNVQIGTDDPIWIEDAMDWIEDIMDNRDSILNYSLVWFSL